jgi:hypothetical protein
VTAKTSITWTRSTSRSERTTALSTASRSSTETTTGTGPVATFTGAANSFLPGAWTLSLYGVLGAWVVFLSGF